MAYPKPVVYKYPDAHPDLEAFPRSESTHVSKQAELVCLFQLITIRFLILLTFLLLKSATPPMAPIINTRVRKDCPATPASSTTVVTKRPKTESSGSRGRARVADFDELSKSLLEESISIYRAQIGGVQPYPDRLEDRDTATGAWVESCNARGVRVEFDEDMLKLVSLTILPNVVLSIRSLHRSLPVHLRSVASSRPSHGLWSRPHMESIQVHPSVRLGT